MSTPTPSEDPEAARVLASFPFGAPLFSQRVALAIAAKGESVDVAPGGSGFGLHARGLLDDDGHITDLGRRVYERMQERTP